MSDAIIGAEALTHATVGHLERTKLFGPKPIPRIIASLGVDVEEFHAMGQSLRDQRDVPAADRGAYSGGFVDGFVLGVRAARYAERGS